MPIVVHIATGEQECRLHAESDSGGAGGSLSCTTGLTDKSCCSLCSSCHAEVFGSNLHFFFHERSSLIPMPSRMWSILYEMRISPSFCSDETKVKSRQVAGE
jgi:hypothetical protein